VRSSTVRNVGEGAADNSARLHILNIQDGSILDGDADVVVAVLENCVYMEELVLYLDGERHSSTRTFPEESGELIGGTFSIQTYWYQNTQHWLEVADNLGNTQTRSVIFHNVISEVDLRSSLDMEPPGDTEFPYHIGALLSPPQSWRVELVGNDDALVMHSVGYGDHIRIDWDGTATTGEVATGAPYQVAMAALESGVTIVVGFINQLT